VIGHFPPALLLLLGSLLVPVLGGRLRSAWLLLLPVLSLVQLLGFEAGSHAQVELAGQTLTLMRVDRLSLAFGYVFHIALFLGILFSIHLEDASEHVSALCYGGSAIGAAFAGDLITLFLFWEVVAVSSVFLIWARRTPRAYAAGWRYLAWQVISGLLLLAGTLVLVAEGGEPTFGHIGLDGGVAGPLLLLAFGIKGAFPVLHTWLVDAYPEGTPTGAVFLSAFTSKLAIYTLIRGFAGADVLVWIGCAMTVFPIFYAVIEDDLRRVLSYSLINQLGFMVVGVGLGTEIAVNGAVAHAFVHIIYKGLLFMTMGAVLQQTGRVHASELGGLYKTMPITAVCCIVGAASISAFPLFSGFVAKSLIIAGVSQEGLIVAWFVLLFAAAGVLEHAGIKVPFFAFFGHDSGLRPAPPPWNMRLAMSLGAALCIGLGCLPGVLYSLLPNPIDPDWHVYGATHVVTQLQLLLFGALGVFGLMWIGRYPPELRATNLDADWLWRRPGRAVWRLLNGPVAGAVEGLQDLLLDRLPAALARGLMGAGPGGSAVARFWAVGSSVLVMVALLLVYVIVGAVSRGG